MTLASSPKPWDRPPGQRFAIDAASEVDYHLSQPGARKRREIFRLETERTLGNDWVVRHENRFYQVERQGQVHAPAKSTVVVCEWEDGTMEIHYRNQKLKCHQIPQRPAKPEEIEEKRRKEGFIPCTLPAPDHPWR